MTTDSQTLSPIVLIHGLWLTPLSWEYWVERFEGKGHRVLAPAWPGLDKPIEELRRNTAPYERLGITEITDHYDAIIRGLDAPPIIIGHSFGGLITMLLLDRGLGASAVAISPAQPKGVLTLPPAQASGGVGGAAQPGQSPQGADADREAVSLRLHEHAQRSG